MSRRSRQLSEEERGLWAEVARTVAPLAGRPAAEVPPGPATTRPGDVDVTPGKPKALSPRAPVSPPLAAFERRVVRALARGQTRAEATLDLHGLTQAQAHARLLGFLRGAQSSGHGLVLVITGRGREGDESRGVLRRLVPQWLGLESLRPIVVGFQEAGTRQGGAGALYVRLRRARG